MITNQKTFKHLLTTTSILNIDTNHSNNTPSRTTINKSTHNHHDDYHHQLSRILHKIERKKLNKIVEGIKEKNSAFRSYLQKNGIVKLTGEDVVVFEGKARKNNIKNEIKSKPNNERLIRNGFIAILNRLNEDKLQQYINQVNYIDQAIGRESICLNEFGQEHDKKEYGASLQNNFMGDLQREQRLNGEFKFITKRIREQSKALHALSNKANKMTHYH